MLTKTNTFKKNLLLFLAPLLIPLLILGAFSIIITRHYIQEEINKNNFNILQQTKNNLELTFDELDSLNINLGTNPEIVITLKKIFDNPRPKVDLEEYNSLVTITNFINAPANARPYIHSIYVYFDNPWKKFLTTISGLDILDSFFDKTWHQSYLANRSQDLNFWTETRNIKEYSFKKKPIRVWSIYRKVYSTSGYKKCIGVIVLNIYTAYLQKILDDSAVPPEQIFLIADAANHIMFSNHKMVERHKTWLAQLTPQAKQSFVLKLDGVAYAISWIYSEKYRLKYIAMIPLKVLYKVPAKLQALTVILLFGSFLLGLIITYRLTKKNYHQVQAIITLIESAENGLPLPELPGTVKDEYSFITNNILKTFIEQKYLQIQLSERKYRLRVMELLALQSQINPHFLFNTLETIKWKIFQLYKRPSQATKMLENLAELLHYSLESPDRKVTLEEEIYNTRNYLEIQKIRYSNKFAVIWEYDEAIKRLPIVRLILQPLLENCIYHGIKEKEGQSIIKIKIRQQGPTLKISVIDNGLGIRREKLAQIRERLRDDHQERDSIGLYNTNKRLILTYGETAAIHIRSKFDYGTVVFFQLPTNKCISVKSEG
jgi:two-component system sensor histidine kinase YesM